MKILVTNDDGIHAIGIKVLSDAMRQIGEVYVIAPDRNFSGASSSLTLSRPLRVIETDEKTYALDGTPTDCVHLGITGDILPFKPDIVVSGINAGSNLGDDVLYSGTVAAAMEGRFMGFPSVAVSLTGSQLEHYHTAAEVAKRLVQQLVVDPLDGDTILNINVPDVPLDKIRSYEITRVGTRHCAEPAIERTDPRGYPVYWIGLPGEQNDDGEGSDFHAIKNNSVSITPMQIDFTHYKMFDHLSSWIKQLDR